MRLFVAINWADETRTQLASLRDELRSLSKHGNFTLNDNLHLTLVFIGECSPKKLDKVIAILDTVAFNPFEATIEKLGTFSRRSKRAFAKLKGLEEEGATVERASFSLTSGNEQAQSLAIWWAGLRKDKPLMDLQREIEHKFALCGFEMDGRDYRPHITLGREVITDTEPWPIEPFSETVTSIDLMQSERINGKLTYTAIYERTSQ